MSAALRLTPSRRLRDGQAVVSAVRAPDLPAWAFTRGARGGRPVVVIEGGRVAACVAVARRAGLAPGDPAQRAADLVPNADVRVRDRSLEAAAWEGAVASLNRLTPWLEDEGDGRAILAGADLAELVALASEAGLAAGLAPTRAHARLASLRAAAGAVVTVAAGGEASFLRATGVDVLEAAGFETVVPERLELLGYGTLGAAASLTRRHLEAQFGTEGRRLYDLLHPGEERPVPLYRPPPALCATVAFEDGFGSAPGEPGVLVPAVDHATAEAAGALRGLLVRRVSVRMDLTNRVDLAEVPRVRSHTPRSAREDGESPSLTAGRILPEASGDGAYLTRQTRGEVLRLLESLRRSHSRAVEVESITVELGSLTSGALTQGRLFDGRPDVYMAARGVLRRFPGSLSRAVITLHAAFPEDSFRFEPLPVATVERAARRTTRPRPAA